VAVIKTHIDSAPSSSPGTTTSIITAAWDI
jgi:hypothetical protein